MQAAENVSLACPEELAIPEAFEVAKTGDYSALEALHDLCIGCRRCEQVCGKEIPILSVIEKASLKVNRRREGLRKSRKRSGK